jgi:hypothetical protein
MNYIRLDASMHRDYLSNFGSKNKIETSISPGGMLGIDCDKPTSCAECIYRHHKNCPGNSKTGRCNLRRGPG